MVSEELVKSIQIKYVKKILKNRDFTILDPKENRRRRSFLEEINFTN